jgi:hypothetical protein
MRGTHARLGAAIAGNVFLLLAFACLAGAIAYPWMQRRDSQRQVESVIADVALLRTAAEGFLGQEDRWPHDDEAPGTIPTELVPALPADFSFDRDGYLLDWERWDFVIPASTPTENDLAEEDSGLLVDSIARPQGPRTRRIGRIGGITVVSSDPGLRAMLLREFGPERSFVRDSAWTFVLGGEPFSVGAGARAPGS